MMHTPLKIDFSTGGVITPSEVTYSFRLLFEERTISILAYNLETVLAEKLETLLSRGTANTRMREKPLWLRVRKDMVRDFAVHKILIVDISGKL